MSAGEHHGTLDATLARQAVQFPALAAGLTFLTWLGAGFLFGFLEPAISEVLLGVKAAGIIDCLKRFFGITCVGGAVTALFVYLATENTWRAAVPRFFPDGRLGKAREAFSLHVRARLLIVLFTVSLVPLPVLGITTFTKAEVLRTADAFTREQVLSSLSTEILVIILGCALFSLLVSIYFSRSLSIPLSKLESAMNSVRQGNLDLEVEILSNDEIGILSEGFNQMVRGLKESESVKASFGKYVSEEIRDEILKGRVQVDGEMKRVTLLFSDLRDFTPFVESAHPKRVIQVMNRYFSQMTEAVKEHRGLVLQYVGDEIEAVFGAPLSYDDHTDMAVKAALEMRRRLVSLNQELQREGIAALRHGIGIHTGAVLAGNIGSSERMSYALVGDTVNLASRIEGLTKRFACDILLSQTTHSLLTEAYRTEQLAAAKVKGKQEEVMVYKLLDSA